MIEPFVSFQMEEKAVARAVESRGFVYMQAMPTASERTPVFDWDTLKNCVETLRRRGYDAPSTVAAESGPRRTWHSSGGRAETDSFWEAV